MTDDNKPHSRRRWLSAFGRGTACLAIMAASAAAVVAINKSEPAAQQMNTRRESAALVETVALERGTYSPRLLVLGTVQPAQDIVLSPRVRGQVIELSTGFVPGGMINSAFVPADFTIEMATRKGYAHYQRRQQIANEITLHNETSAQVVKP